MKRFYPVAFHPQSNEIVERSNRKILEVLRHLVRSLQEGWEYWLNHVMACINSSLHSSVGKTPHYIVYGEKKILPYDILVQNPQPVYNIDDYVSVHTHAFATIHKEVRRHMEESQTECIPNQQKVAREVDMIEGDVGMLKRPERLRKVAPIFSGPYKVGKVRGNKITIRENMEDISK